MIRFCATVCVVAVCGFSILNAGELSLPGIVLPLQDRVGDPRFTDIVERVLLRELSQRHELITDASSLRDALRRLRIRNAATASSTQLQQFASELGGDWFLSVTLHRADDSPQLTVSGWLYRPGQRGLAWAGFESASGLDSRRVLGLGVIDDFEVLATKTIRSLVEDLETQPQQTQRRRKGRKSPRGGFLSTEFDFDDLDAVAVVPFDAVTDRSPIQDAETLTQLARAVLYRHGVGVAFPGRVNEAMRQSGLLQLGGIDRKTGLELYARTGAGFVLTGVVERYNVAGGLEAPQPSVAFGARLIDTNSGRIVWIRDEELEGWDRQKLFGAGKVHDPGTVAEQLMESLVSDFLVTGQTKKR